MFHVPLSLLEVKSEKTGLLDNVDKVRGVIKSIALLVITTLTSAPCFANRRTIKADLYAAILPVTASTTFLPFNMMFWNFKLLLQ